METTILLKKWGFMILCGMKYHLTLA